MSEWTKERHEELQKETNRLIFDLDVEEVENPEEIKLKVPLGDIRDALAEIDRLNDRLAFEEKDNMEEAKCLLDEIDRLRRVAEAAEKAWRARVRNDEENNLNSSCDLVDAEEHTVAALKAWREGK